MSGAEQSTSQAYGVATGMGTYVWITTASPSSPNAAVVGTPIANPVANPDINTLSATITGTNVSHSITTQELTTMTNAVPHDDFNANAQQLATHGGSMPDTQNVQISDPHQHPQNQQVRSTNGVDPLPLVLEATVIEVSEVQGSRLDSFDYVEIDEIKKNDIINERKEEKPNPPQSTDKTQRRRLSPAHREMIIDLVFNEKKTSREVARYMGLPQSTVMSVVQVFKKEHRIHKKTATGRKRRLSTAQEFQLFDMSQERDNITVDEIRSRFLQQHPTAGHISKTTIYRTLERGKKGLIGMDPPAEKYGESNERYWNHKKKSKATLIKSTTNLVSLSAVEVPVNPPITLMEETATVQTIEKESCRQRKSLSIAEREMIISLFFNENRTIREVADFMHLAKSTVSSVVQVFKKEHRIQRKASTGRKKKLSDVHEQMIMDILSEKEDITIEETRSRFLNSNPQVPTISKSTVYRIMENCQSKMKSRSDMEVFVGTFVHSTEEKPMVILTDTVMGILNSTIEFMENIEELDHLKAEYGFSDSTIQYMTSNQFMMPGLIDTHTHACQLPNNGLAMASPLVDWLQNFTFPTEANFQDTLFAREVYAKVVDRFLHNGTTTASYLATIHLEGTKILADVVNNKGQRAFIGKVNQIRNCPDYYQELSVESSINETEQFIKYVISLESALIQPIITPRFAPTCPEDQLCALGQLARKYNCHIQSHLCETRAEIQWVKELFPWSKTYTEVYDNMRLLTDKTIMAHCIWMTDAELNILRERGTGVAHCPNSNISSKAGICDVKRLLSHNLKVGLGTDCSAGYNTSMLDAMRMAVTCSNILSMDRDDNFQTLTIEESFQLATLGGAKVLNMENKIGNFEIDKEFDALLIDVSVTGSPVDLLERDTVENKIKKFLYNGDDRNIIKVFVEGKKVVDQNMKLLP